MGTIDKRPLKAYVRFDGSGRIVAGSLILRRKMPKVGKWMEIPAYQCCNPTTSTTTTAIPIPTIICIGLADGGGGYDYITFNYIETVGGYPIYEFGNLRLVYDGSSSTWSVLTIDEGTPVFTSDTTTTTNVLEIPWPGEPGYPYVVITAGPCGG